LSFVSHRLVLVESVAESVVIARESTEGLLLKNLNPRNQITYLPSHSF
jgi:hypothetical protein